MARLGNLRGTRVVLLVLATLVAVPGTFFIRQKFFAPRLNVASIKAESAYQDPLLLERAYQLPVAASYRKDLLFQENGSLCGPTSVVNVERSLGKPATVARVLEGTGKCWTGVCWLGLTLDELAGVTRRATGRKVTLLRGLTLGAFREELRHVNDPGRRYIANFHRAPLFAQGGGHHSPLAGYLEDQDLVLVLDVNEDYRPWLAETERLFQAIDTSDSGSKRGLLRIE